MIAIRFDYVMYDNRRFESAIVINSLYMVSKISIKGARRGNYALLKITIRSERHESV